jgi:hypothetical protein
MNTAMTREDELLVKALPHGQIYLMHAGQIGDFVRAGSFDYHDDGDPALQAIGIEALENAMRRGFVRHDGGQLYKLTGTGFERAKQHAQQ